MKYTNDISGSETSIWCGKGVIFANEKEEKCLGTAYLNNYLQSNIE